MHYWLQKCHLTVTLTVSLMEYENYISEGLKENSRKEEKDFEENPFEAFDLEDFKCTRLVCFACTCKNLLILYK